MEFIKKPLLISTLLFMFMGGTISYAGPPSSDEDSPPQDQQAKAPSSEKKAAVPSIEGEYQCKGYDPYGKSSYANPVSVTKNGDTFSFQWLTSRGYPFILGTGVLSPDVDNVISVVFWDPKKADYFGTEVFKIGEDGSLNAVWTLQGENQVGTESCVKK